MIISTSIKNASGKTSKVYGTFGNCCFPNTANYVEIRVRAQLCWHSFSSLEGDAPLLKTASFLFMVTIILNVASISVRQLEDYHWKVRYYFASFLPFLAGISLLLHLMMLS